jgi:hypothetical protein
MVMIRLGASSLVVDGTHTIDVVDVTCQAHAFYTTWLQPPGYVHGMIGGMWQPNNLALGFTINGGRPSMAGSHAVSAHASSDGRTVVGRVVNTDNSTRTSSNFELQCV